MKLRIVIVGFGFMGQMHAGVYRALAAQGREVKIVGVVDSFPGAAEAMAKAGLKAPGFPTLEEALKAVECEAVDICLPTDLHAAHIRTARWIVADNYNRNVRFARRGESGGSQFVFGVIHRDA